MKLYCSAISPYARKCMILNRLKGLGIEEIGVSPDGPRGYTEGANPLGKIPALVIPGQPVMVSSPVICEYLDSLKDPLLPASGLETSSVRFTQLRQHALGDGLSDPTYQYRYETVRPETLHWDDIIARQDYAMRSAVMALEAEVPRLGEGWTFGGLAVVTAMDYLSYRGPHIDWRAMAPNLAAWHKNFEADPAYIDTYKYEMP